MGPRHRPYVVTEERLWPFAVRVYARPGVQPLLIELQDAHGQCVSLLLWALWLCAGKRVFEPARLAEAVRWARTWSAAVVDPLRQMRRNLKRPLAGEPDAERQGLRRQVADLELEAERILLGMLETASPAADAESVDAARALETTVAAWGESAPLPLLRRLASLAV